MDIGITPEICTKVKCSFWKVRKGGCVRERCLASRNSRTGGRPLPKECPQKSLHILLEHKISVYRDSGINRCSDLCKAKDIKYKNQGYWWQRDDRTNKKNGEK